MMDGEEHSQREQPTVDEEIDQPTEADFTSPEMEKRGLGARFMERYTSAVDTVRDTLGGLYERVSTTDPVQNVVDRVRVWESDGLAERFSKKVDRVAEKKRKEEAVVQKAEAAAQKVAVDLQRAEETFARLGRSFDNTARVKANKERNAHIKRSNDARGRADALSAKMQGLENQRQQFQEKARAAREAIDGRLREKVETNESFLTDYRKEVSRINDVVDANSDIYKVLDDEIAQLDRDSNAITDRRIAATFKKPRANLVTQQKEILKRNEKFLKQRDGIDKKIADLEATNADLSTKRMEVTGIAPRDTTLEGEESPAALEVGEESGLDEATDSISESGRSSPEVDLGTLDPDAAFVPPADAVPEEPIISHSGPDILGSLDTSDAPPAVDAVPPLDLKRAKEEPKTPAPEVLKPLEFADLSLPDLEAALRESETIVKTKRTEAEATPEGLFRTRKFEKLKKDEQSVAGIRRAFEDRSARENGPREIALLEKMIVDLEEQATKKSEPERRRQIATDLGNRKKQLTDVIQRFGGAGEAPVLELKTPEEQAVKLQADIAALDVALKKANKPADKDKARAGLFTARRQLQDLRRKEGIDPAKLPKPEKEKGEEKKTVKAPDLLQAWNDVREKGDINRLKEDDFYGVEKNVRIDVAEPFNREEAQALLEKMIDGKKGVSPQEKKRLKREEVGPLLESLGL